MSDRHLNQLVDAIYKINEEWLKAEHMGVIGEAIRNAKKIADDVKKERNL